MLNDLRIKHSSILLWTLLIMSTSSYINKAKFNSDASIISSLLEKIIKPHIENNEIIESKPRQRAEEYKTVKNRKIDIENAIRRNVIELKPILQDSELNNDTKIETDYNLKLEGNDETTIIELVPENNRKANTRKTKELTDTFQRKIENYKQLRHNITKLLENVQTDSSTKKLITKTLDGMLALLIERQCTLKNEGTGEVMNQLLKDTRKSIQSIQKVGKKKDLATLKEGYWAPFRGLEFHDETNGPLVVLKDIKSFVYQILMNSWNVVDQYRVSCYLRQKDKDTKSDDRKCSGSGCHITAQPRAFGKSFDRDSKNEDTNQCDSFSVCTEELSAFLTKTYKSLNDTAVDTFRSYAFMYMRDVKKETNIDDDNIVNRELNDLRVSAETKIHKIFMDEMDQFTQDALKTKKEVTIQLINNFITGTIAQIKSSLYTLVLEKLNGKAAIFSRIKDDLLVNLRVDMDSLNQQISDSKCDSFALCNGKPNLNSTRRFYNKRSPKNDVYVQLEISLDDQLKDSLARFSQQNMNTFQGLKNITYGIGRSLISAIDRRKYSYVNVTRTTVGSAATTKESSDNGLAD